MQPKLKKISINGRLVGPGAPAYIIAEIGINHNGDLKLATQMVEAASQLGVDAVKFQLYRTESLVSRSSPAFQILEKCQLNEKDVSVLAQKATDLKITFLATAFDEDSVDLLAGVNVPAFKIASGDLTHLPLLRHVAQYGKPVIISTGGATIGEVEDAVGWAAGAPIALLHCVSHYPTDPSNANLRVLDTLQRQFNVPIGYSDHTIGTLIPTMACALGASIIEKHFTLDKQMEGPDQKSSGDPDDFRKMIREIREVEKALGCVRKFPVENEEVRSGMRRSITASVDIPKGAVITRRKIDFKRPGNGIPPKDMDKVIGRVAVVDIPMDETLLWDKV